MLREAEIKVVQLMNLTFQVRYRLVKYGKIIHFKKIRRKLFEAPWALG